MRQRDRVLRALQRYPGGLTQVDFLLPNVIDGGRPITRLAARVKDLRDDGHRIDVDGERYGCAVYKLPQAAPVPIPPPKPVVPMDENATPDALFDMPAQRTPLTPYSDLDAA